VRGPEGYYLQGGFAWIHRPETPARAGLVIVPPFGYEAVCAQRSLRHLAEAAARAGLLAIRIDLPGTGDARGDDLEPDRVGAWIAAILEARKLATRGDDDTVPLDRVVLCGVRLGAVLASVAAARLRAGETLAPPGEKPNVVGVVAIAAVASGRAIVREGRALQATLDLAPAPAGLAPPEDVHEVVGFAQTAETRAKLGEIDLLKLSLPAPEMLVIDRDDLPPNDKWVARLRELGANVEHARLPGYVEMVLDPHKTVVPDNIIDTTVAFASRLGGDPVGPSGFRLAGSSFFAGPIRENPVDIDAYLRGFETKPATGTPTRGVILLNAGAVGHIGPNRLYVELARMLAARGDRVLRVDLSGIGDSEPRPGAEENVVYSEHALGDVAACVAWMRKQGVQHVAVAGLCSGAYHALKAAIAGQPIDTVVAINPLTFHYVPGMPLDFAAFRVTADAQRYAKSARSTESWKKLLRGDVDVGRVAKIVMTRARQAAEHRGKDVLRRLRVPLKDDLGTDLLALARRGVAMRFIFSASDPGAAMLAEEGGSAVTRLVESGALSIRVIDGPDHTFTPRWSHPLLLDAIASATAP
jgi:alpha-beta hydrolase superfamily lysophospholipase